MAINNNDFDADEEITHTHLNQLNSDANNSTDDIHPQYHRFHYDRNIYKIIGGAGGNILQINSAGGRIAYITTTPIFPYQELIKNFGIKIPNASLYTNARIKFSAARTGSGSVSIDYAIAKNGVNVSFVNQLITSAFSTYADYDITIPISLSTNSIIDFSISMTCNAGTTETLYCKNIELFLE